MKINLEKELRKYYKKSKTEYRFKVMMDTLYNMCRKSKKHSTVDINTTISKLMLIGRSHAASLERRKNTEDYAWPYPSTAKKIAKIKDFDLRISKINKYQFPFKDDQIKEINKIVYQLTKVFEEMTGMAKPSLASKYLHFHAPIVPKYDSYASKAVNSFDLSFDSVEFGKYKSKYSQYLLKINAAGKEVRRGIDKKASPMDVDNFLLYWWS